MMRLSSAAAVLAAAASAWAAPAPVTSKQTGPMVVVQMKSLAGIKTRVGFALLKLVGLETARKIGDELDKAMTVPEGIDRKRPFAVYGDIDLALFGGDFAKSKLVLMVPVTGDKAALEAIEKLGFKAEPIVGAAGLYEVPLPGVPFTAYLRFADKYAYVSLGSQEVLEPRALLKPDDVIDAKEPALVRAKLRGDGLPPMLFDFLKTAGDGLMQKIKQEADTPPEIVSALQEMLNLTVRWKDELADAREFVVRLDIDGKSAVPVVELVIEPKDKSKLAKAFARYKTTRNRFAGLMGKPDAVADILLRAPLFAKELQTGAGLLAAAGSSGVVKEATRGRMPAEVVTLLTQSLTCLKKTVESGDMDLALTVRGPDKAGLYTAGGAVALQDAELVGKVLKDARSSIPEEIRKLLTFDADKVGELPVHSFALADEFGDETVVKIFGDKRR